MPRQNGDFPTINAHATVFLSDNRNRVTHAKLPLFTTQQRKFLEF